MRAQAQGTAGAEPPCLDRGHPRRPAPKSASAALNLHSLLGAACAVAHGRSQRLLAATAFARGGFAATRLDEVAPASVATGVILYPHFKPDADLYRAMLDRTWARLVAAVGAEAGDFTPESVGALIGAAAEDPDGFRLLIQHAAREPSFKAEIDWVRAGGVDIARHYLAQLIRRSCLGDLGCGPHPHGSR